MEYILLFVLLTPAFGAFLLAWFRFDQESQKVGALLISLITFLASLFLWIGFDPTTPEFQFVLEGFPWIDPASLNFRFIIGIDGISLFLVLLTTLLFPICILLSWGEGFQGRGVGLSKSSSKPYQYGNLEAGSSVSTFLQAFLLLETLLIGVFTILDVFLFYIFFESVLLPMYLIIGIWGSRERKIKAAYQFFLYTLAGSLLMVLGILFLYFQTGSTDFQTLSLANLSERRQILLWLSFFLSFAIKVPMMPFHLWLPEAHVEAPTSGSVVLAGILLKLGTYGFLRFSLPLFPIGSSYFAPLITTLSVIAVIYGSLITLRQVDLKKIIAYSSVAHMGFVTLGLFSPFLEDPTVAGQIAADQTNRAISGALFLMLSHGVVSSALFLCVGSLYERHKTRLISYYGGLVFGMPLFSILFFIMILANLSLPGTSNFVGEFLVLLPTFQFSTLLAVFGATGMVLGAGYSIWLYNRVVFGGIPKVRWGMTKFADLNRREFFSFLPLVIGMLWMGVYPDTFLRCFAPSVAVV